MKNEELTPGLLDQQSINFAVPSVKERLITGTVLNLIATAFNQGGTLVVNILIARILMKEGFGEYAMAQNTLLTIATLGQLAIGYTAAKYVAEYRSTDPQRAGRIIGLCALVSVTMASVATVILILVAPWLAASMLKASHLSFALMIGSGFVFFSAINGYQTGALSGLEAYSGLAKAGVSSGITAITTIFLGAWMGGLNGAMLGLSVSAFARCLIHNRFFQIETRAQGIKPDYSGSLCSERAIISKFALPAAIAGYYSMPIYWLVNSFLVRQAGGYGEMALYSAATNFRLLVLFIPNVMNNVGLSILNNVKAKGDVAHYHHVFGLNVVSIFIVTLGAIILVGISGRPILKLFGEDFVGGYFLLWLLLASTLFEGLSIGLYQYIQSRARIWLSLFVINIPRDGFFFVTAYYLVQSHGGTGLATAYLMSAILGLLFHCVLVVFIYKEKDKNTLSYKIF